MLLVCSYTLAYSIEIFRYIFLNHNIMRSNLFITVGESEFPWCPGFLTSFLAITYPGMNLKVGITRNID